MSNNTQDYAEDIQYLKDSVKILNALIRGDKHSPRPQGLIQLVDRNTRFRKITTAWLYLLAVTTTGLVIERLLSAFGIM